MRNLDLEKVIIILSLLALPCFGWWVMSLKKELAGAEIALRNAKRKDGMVQKIYEMQQLIDETKRELDQQGDKATDATNYFRNRMSGSTRPGSTEPLTVGELTVDEQKPSIYQARGNRAGYEDVTVNLRWGKNGKKTLTREFINAYVVNCESQSPIWKLRSLHLINNALGGRGGRATVPSGEIADEWQVNKMSFARRKPLARGK